MNLIKEICNDWATQRPDINCSGKAVICSILRIRSNYLCHLEKALKPLGIAPNVFSVLVTLRRKGASAEISVSKIREEVLVSSGGMTNLLNRLINDALISKRACENDARCMLVKLTPKGLDIIDKAMEIQASLECKMTAMLTQKENNQLSDLLRKLLEEY